MKVKKILSVGLFAVLLGVGVVFAASTVIRHVQTQERVAERIERIKDHQAELVSFPLAMEGTR